jgi:sugar transferase (PEP-CTERM/EpsH1 system associated)
VDSQKWYDFAGATRGPRRRLYRLEGRRVRAIERELPRWARAVSVVSRAEADLYDAIAGPGAATVATNGVDLDYFTPADGPIDRACVFVGALDYLPNVDAAVWFAREVWPALHAEFPDAEFRVVGRNPAAAVRALAAVPGVKVIGPVSDVRLHLARAAVAVVPLRLARGVQNKVLEALAMGKPTVAAPAALAALRAVLGEHLLAASTPAEWVAAVGGLFADPARCRELAAAGRRYVEENHDWARCLEPLLDRIFAPVAPKP